MQIWPQNGWFLGLRRVLFSPAYRKRRLTVLTLAIIFIGIMEVVSRPDTARLEQEQYLVYSAYLFEASENATPFPVRCANDAAQTTGDESSGIQQYWVSERTLSVFSQPSAFWGVVQRKMETPFIPTAVFNNFFNRNLAAEKLTKKFSGPKADRLSLVPAPADMPATDHPTRRVKFSKVGFNRDFSWAMFYAEGSCGGLHGREYVYMSTPLYRWRRYWYVVKVARE